MKAIILKCPPYARFHFGTTGLDENASLYTTSTWMHSDTLFSALMITCNKVFGSESTDTLCEAVKAGNLLFSSAFYFLENSQKDRVFFLPKPDHFGVINKDTKNRKAVRKVAFISKGVWEKGIVPSDWMDKEENGQMVLSDCVILQGKFVILKSELQTLYALSSEAELSKYADQTKQFKVFEDMTAPKIADHARRRENNIFFQTDLHFAVNNINGQEIRPHFYFMYESTTAQLESQLKFLCEVIIDEGIGGAISTGCGRLLRDESGKVETDIDLSTDSISDTQQVSVSLISPNDATELEQIKYYKILTRGGRPVAWGGRLEFVKLIKEGALVTGKVNGNVPKLEVVNPQKTPKYPYFRNGKALCLPIHKNYTV